MLDAGKTDQTLLEVNNIEVIYNHVILVLKGVSLKVPKGGITALLGGNGAGKTTTLKAISNLLKSERGEVTKGSITYRGERVQDLLPSDLVKMGVIQVMEGRHCFEHLTVEENLEFYARVFGTTVRENYELIKDIYSHIEPFKNRRAGKLSGGMKQKLGLACSLIKSPQMLLLDEPTVGVDPQSRNAIFEHVEQLRDEGVTVIYTTHYMEEAERLCNRVAIIDEGSIVALDTPEKLIADLGGGIIHLGALDGALTPELLKRIESLPNIKNVARFDGKMEVETTHAQEALVHLLELLNRTDTNITSLQVLEPNLETVFLHLTGKQLRDH